MSRRIGLVRFEELRLQSEQILDDFPGVISAIAAGDGSQCGIDSEFNVYCWGEGSTQPEVTEGFYSVSCSLACCGLRSDKEQPVVCCTCFSAFVLV